MKRLIVLITVLMLMSGCTAKNNTPEETTLQQSTADSTLQSYTDAPQTTIPAETTTEETEEYQQIESYNPKDYPDYINLLANFDYTLYISGWSDYLFCSADNVSLLLADVDGDGMAESVLRFDSYHTITCDLIFKVIDGSVKYIGGYSSGRNDMSFKRYKDKNGNFFGITTEEYSSYDGSNTKVLIRDEQFFYINQNSGWFDCSSIAEFISCVESEREIAPDTF